MEPPVYRFKPPLTPGGRREKVMTRRAIRAHVCQAHGEMVTRERQAQADRKAAERARRKKTRAT